MNQNPGDAQEASDADRINPYLSPAVLASDTEDNSTDTRQTFLYFGSLTLLLYLASPAGYLVDIPTSYMLKNQLHASADQVATFRLITAIPVYLAFAFGLIRDWWNPFGLRDRGYFLVFAPVTAIVFLALAFSPVTYLGLYLGMFLTMLASRFVSAAYQGLMALVGQEKLMTGRLTVLWQVVSSVPIVGGALIAGYISNLDPKYCFLIFAGIPFCIGLMGLWKPASVFRHAYDQPQAKGTNFIGDIQRLMRHRAIYPAVLIMFLWSFAPGSNTPLQYYLTNVLHASDADYGNFNAIFSAAFVPTFLLYGFLCKKVNLKKLLWWGTVFAVPQMIPLAFIHSPNLALVLAAPIGLMGGVATAAYYDLAMRSCPPGLQGTLMMMVDGVYLLASRGGDVLGSKIYESSPTYGFLYCVIATTVVYALILPVILLIPKNLIATAEGEPNPEVEADLLNEITETP
jgi:MFS family permease